MLTRRVYTVSLASLRAFARWVKGLAPGSGLSWRLVLLALGLRVLLTPLQHTWDSQTWWNVLAQLGSSSNPLHAVALPYNTMREMSDIAAGNGRELHYEYWAYPPAMLIVWWPIARLWTLAAGPMLPQFAIPDTFTAVPFPLVLSLIMKVPAILADLALALLLGRLVGARTARWYLFNPYVLLVCFWTFDPVMVALLLAGLFAAEKQRWALSGVLLGLGAAVKFVPGLFAIAICLWAVQRSRTPLRSAFIAGATTVGVFALVCLPWVDGVRYVLTFHTSRPGGGMSWQSVWNALSWLHPLADMSSVHLSLSSDIGDLTLTAALLLAAWLIWYRRLELWEASLVVALAYLAGSKLVNEVYPLPAVVIAAVLYGRRPAPNGRVLLAILWVVPLLFALVNVPAWGFLASPAEELGLLTRDAAWTFYQGYAQTYQYLSPVLAAVGGAFQLACLWGVWQVVHRPAMLVAPRMTQVYAA